MKQINGKMPKQTEPPKKAKQADRENLENKLKQQKRHKPTKKKPGRTRTSWRHQE